MERKTRNAIKRTICSLLVAVVVLGVVPISTFASSSAQLSINWNHINSTGYQSVSGPCFCYALAYCRNILDGKTHSWTEYRYNSDSYLAVPSKASYSKQTTSSAQIAYKAAYDNINMGRPVIFYVNGGRSTSQHYIAIVGYTNVSNTSNLSANNFLIIDSALKKSKSSTENMGTVGYRLLLDSTSKYKYYTTNSGNALPTPAFTYSFNYDSNGGSGSMSSFNVSAGDTFTLSRNAFTKSGHSFEGWHVRRNNDNTWYVIGKGWCTEATISSNGYSKKLYSDGCTLGFDDGWTNGLSGDGSYTFVAVWKADDELLNQFVFDVNFYRAVNGDLKNYSDAQLTTHWLEHGCYEGRRASYVFCVKDYLEIHVDLKQHFGDDYVAAIEHFVDSGISEGRISSYEFNPSFYKNYEENEDVKNHCGDDWYTYYLHYLVSGLKEGRAASSSYIPKIYINNYPDLMEKYKDDYYNLYIHWITSGKSEHRIADRVCEGFPSVPKLYVNYKSSSGLVFMDWSATTNTTQYDVHIYNKQTNVDDIKFRIHNNFYYVDLPAGDYKITVCAVNEELVSESVERFWTDSNSVDIHLDGDEIGDSNAMPDTEIKYLNGHIYEFFNHRCSWNAAESYAESKGGHLMTVTSQAEQELIDEYWHANGEKDWLWLGATDRNVEGKWQWVTGEAFEYKNWYDGEPSNCDTYGDAENYLGTFHDSKWNDFANYPYDVTGFVIEYDNPDVYTVYRNGNLYEFYDIRCSWETAKSFAESMGGHLATINNEDEQNELLAYWNSHNKTPKMWLGGYRDDSGVWRWITGEEFGYTNWYPGSQPDNYKGLEKYLGSWNENYWNDYCNVPAHITGFVVEYEISKNSTTSYKGNTYETYWSNCNWYAAKKYAELCGGHLVTITSQGEQDHITSLLSQDYHRIWLGAKLDENNNWQWVTGETFEYTSWDTGQPDNASGAEKYLQEFFASGTWNDNTSRDKNSHGFIIEKEHEHSYTGSVTIPATCANEGTKTFKCNICDKFYTEKIPATGHTSDSGTITTQPTCTQTGVKTYKCTVCNATIKTETVAAKGHTSQSVSAVAATCTEKGKTAGTKCSVCGVTLSGLTETHALGHDFSSWTKLNDTQHQRVCSRDSSHIEKANHTWNSGTITTQPTCTKTGVKTYTCTACSATKTETISATGHSSDSGTITTPPTCTQTGVKTYKCTTCGTTIKTETVAAKGHTSQSVSAVAATCTEKGKTAGTKCSVCGVTLSGLAETPALGHDYKATVTTQPTCTTEGVKTYKCSRCTSSYTEKISATGHTVITDEAVAPTCTETGLTQGSHCSACNIVLVAQKIVPATGHAYGEWTVTKPATCTEKGVETRVCANDENHIETRDIAIDSKSHNFKFARTVAPTCTEAGYDIYTCSRCEATEQRNEVAAKGHSVVIDEAVDPTCTETGLTQGSHCSACNTVLVAQEAIPATGHIPGEWEVERPATVASEGNEILKCTVCTEILEERAIPKLSGPVPGTLYLDKKPSKISYELNEAFDPTGAVLRVKYNDGTIKSLSSSDVQIVGFDTTTGGNKKVHFSYTENGVTLNTWEFTILVDRQVTAIFIPHKPNKTHYICGEAFEREGMEIIATYSDGTKADVTAEVRTSGYDSLTFGLKKMTVSYTYKGKTVTLQFSYEMNPKLTGLVLTHKPNKLGTYKVGEPLSKEGMIITAKFSDGSTKDVTHLIRTSGYSSKQVGKQIITVSYTYGTQTKKVQFSIIMSQ